MTNIEKYMLTGHFRSIESGNRVVLGEGLLRKLGAHVGDSVQIGVGKGLPLNFMISGIFRLGVSTVDETTIFASLADAQTINRTPSQISDIALKLQDVTQASELARNWSVTSPDKVQSWDQSNTSILSVFKTQDIVRNSMTISILIVAGFGIYNILNMVVSQKRKEIGVLRSMGFDSFDIIKLFMVQGVILGALGGLLGLGVGLLACHGVALIPVDQDRLGGGHMFMSYDSLIYFKGYGLAFGSAAMASFFPSLNAGKLSPIDIIRSEGA